MTITIRTRDRARQFIGEVDVQQLTATLRFSRTSNWVCTVDALSNSAPLFDLADGIVITRDNETILSGPIRTRQRTLASGRQTLTVSGTDDTAYLDQRLALPVPSGPPYTADDYDSTTAVAETVLRYYVDRNIGPAATVSRRIPGLTLAANAGLGSTVRGNARFHNLLELLQTLAVEGGDLGFRVVQVGSGLVFQVYAPQDRTATAVFSQELGNLAGFDYTIGSPTANYVYVGGQGEGTARTLVEGGSTDAVAQDRYELFADRRDTNDTATLQQARDGHLVEGQAATALALTTIDTPAVSYGVDYRLGDRVRVLVDDNVIDDVLREVTLTYTNADSERLTPVVGTPGSTNPLVPPIFAAQRDLARRVAQLERP